ncbi:uncharacterized protein EV422DRAFT_559569 [Fimicolochytrium jonesii]|uniref:uncharacterized protein n=1 Tax=Fimicolochytrium jonesii TaxID=1396493 RepID=UPI0022FE2755|nr:uncharacterized protein EV422DRAFT_559569 [Fimicolochytrium jonesii]KAI8818607.1 hypothetical protein EV422DRAFT_559569 [Fimicolochytrium jonesii]
MTELGSKFGRPDLDRIGIFSEAPYISIGDRYISNKNGSSLSERNKGKQFLTNPGKRGHDTKDVYFVKDSIRLFENESYTDPVSLRRRWRIQAKEKNIVPNPFRPSNVPPTPSGKGSFYGTFAQQWPIERKNEGSIPSFTATRESARGLPPKKNFLTNPPKKGTGYGYPNVTIGTAHEYIGDAYNAAEMGNRKDHAEHKKRVVGERPFVSSGHHMDFFNNFVSLDTTDGAKAPPKPTSAKRTIKQPNVPFKPSSYPGYTINKYPSAEEPGKASEPTHPKGPTLIFRPGGVPKTYPIRSIVETNIPLAPPPWIRAEAEAVKAMTTSLKAS